MPIINFSHFYPKLATLRGREIVPITQARLLQTFVVDLADLSAEFLDYDTAAGTYQLPTKGKFLLLIFLKPGGVDLFTTLRRWTPEKERFYTQKTGEIFYISLQQPAKQ